VPGDRFKVVFHQPSRDQAGSVSARHTFACPGGGEESVEHYVRQRQ
jgi:hypothetical protein